MREVLSVAATAGALQTTGISSTGTPTPNANNNIDADGRNNNTSSPEAEMRSSHPGYLDLPEDRALELVSDRPIEEFYEVEDQPFARGKYATVRRCRCRNTGQQFAAKVVRKRRRSSSCNGAAGVPGAGSTISATGSSDLRAEILHEVAVLDACRGCPRIVRLHRVFESANDMVLLLELAVGGELQMVLDRDEVPEEHQVARLMKQILHGLVFLHNINVAHLDLKPQNLVLTGDFPDCDVKLCDFGISRYLSQGADVREILGTPDYVAPEVLNYEPISLATDMWSVGVLMYVLLTGCSPFGGETKQETFCNISQCRLDFPDDLFEDVSDNAKDLMRNLIVKDPKRRLSAAECLQHHWFSSLESMSCLVPRSPSPAPAPAPALASVAAPAPAAPAAPAVPAVPATLPYARRHSLASTPPPLPSTPPPQAGLLPLSSTASDSSLSSRSTPRTGISAMRRNNFMRNMESIVQRLSAGDLSAKGEPAACSTPTASQRPLPRPRAQPHPATTGAGAPGRPVSRATAMQTMPIRSHDGYRFDRGFEVPSDSVARNVPVGLSASNATSTSVIDLRAEGSSKDSVFKFRKVYILEDSEDVDAMTHMPSPPPSINGSTGSSVYSDNSISDSSSDTVSELSVDSSSDRSSIISLDDSWDVAYARLNGRPYHGLSYTSYNVWDRTTASVRQRGRECHGSFARALSRFAAETEDKTLPKAPPLTAHNKPILSKLALMQTAINNGKRCGLELMREQNSNLVVIREIREVKPGGRYARFSEVKCESVQSRIRKLQVQGAKS